MGLPALTRVMLFTLIVSTASFYSIANTADSASAEICTTALGFDFKACPQDFRASALANSPQQMDILPCEVEDGDCAVSEATYPGKTHYVTFFDVDNQQTLKYAITTKPDVYDRNNNDLMTGSQLATAVAPTKQEVNVTAALAEIARLKQSMPQHYQLYRDEDGVIRDASGQLAEARLLHSSALCQTALDYTQTRINCSGALNTDIDNAIARDPNFQSLQAAITKLLHAANQLPSLHRFTAPLANLASFRLVRQFSDSSELVLDVTAIQGAGSIVLNKHASRTTEQRTFAGAMEYGTSGQGSHREAKVVAISGFIPKRCEPVDFSHEDWQLAEKVTLARPNGGAEVFNIYRRQDRYITYQQCTGS